MTLLDTFIRDREKLEAEANQRYGKFVQHIESETRKLFLLPFCKKHKLMFDSGMGSYSFHDETGRDVYLDNSRPAAHNLDRHSDEDKDWIQPGEEEKQIEALLDWQPDLASICIGAGIKPITLDDIREQPVRVASKPQGWSCPDPDGGHSCPDPDGGP